MTRERNYWEGHPRAQAATDAILGGLGGTVVGYMAAVVTIGAAAATSGNGNGKTVGLGFAGLMLPLVGGIVGASMAAGRRRKGFSEPQRKRAGRGAAFGSIIPFVGAPAGTFFWTERSKNPR